MTVDELKDVARSVSIDFNIDDLGIASIKDGVDVSDFLLCTYLLIEEVMSLDDSYIPVN